MLRDINPWFDFCVFVKNQNRSGCKLKNTSLQLDELFLQPYEKYSKPQNRHDGDVSVNMAHLTEECRISVH